ncbi:hypothetical protein, partial [Actinosynnema sp.]|uniref:hypothetical protein n=1 Tax=Actinosynnema sp. TaxID=1872144 RepID=UPI003F8266B3
MTSPGRIVSGSTSRTTTTVPAGSDGAMLPLRTVRDTAPVARTVAASRSWPWPAVSVHEGWTVASAPLQPSSVPLRLTIEADSREEGTSPRMVATPAHSIVSPGSSVR